MDSEDPDLLALLSEIVLELGEHPYLAMHYIERGLKNQIFEEIATEDKGESLRELK